MDNKSDISDGVGFSAPPLERYFVSFFTCLMAWPLSCMYVLIMYVIARNKPLRTNPFFVFALNLGVADMIQMVTIILHGVFITANGNPREFPSILNEIHVALQSVSFFCQLLLMNVIAINRYVATCWFPYYKRIFTARSAVCICIFCWLFGLAMDIWRTIGGVHLIYMVYSFNYDGVDQSLSYSGFLKTNNVVVTVGIFAPFIIYVILLLQLRIKTVNAVSLLQSDEAEMRRRRSEKILMFQFSVITLVFSLYESSFQFVFELFDTKVAFIFLNFMNILNCTINPIMYLCFGSELKKYIRFKSDAQAKTNFTVSTTQNVNRHTTWQSATQNM